MLPVIRDGCACPAMPPGQAALRLKPSEVAGAARPLLLFERPHATGVLRKQPLRELHHR